MRKSLMWAACMAALAISACSENDDSDESGAQVTNTEYPEQVFWGDTHLHTDNSIDAFGFGNRLDAEAALRFARGEEVTATKGAKAKLSRPLDFLVIADHSDAMGATKAIMEAPRIALLTNKFLLRWHDMMNESEEGSLRVTGELIDGAAKGTLPASLTDPEETRDRTADLWEKHGETVDQYNEPGKFTAFMGFEYTSMPDGDNLHRVVMFRDSPKKMGDTIPFGALGEQNPERLWAYMAAYEKNTGGKVLAIPHNSNVSNGRMFAMNKFDGSPIDAAYVKTRALREPIVEVTQIKGDSEAHPFLSPNDEFADFGVAGWDKCNLSCTRDMQPESYGGSYVREALKRGLELTLSVGANPFKFGMIGSTDSHTSLATADENNFFGKHSGNEANNRGRVMAPQNLGTREGRFGWHYLSSGYAAVWATSNTREAIFDAMMRREVYATTGPRMQVRFFGGFDFTAEDTADLVKTGYTKGVPMGGDLKGGDGEAPQFLISALMDPESASLDRIQVIKGWVDATGKSQEKIYNVSWSNADARKLGANGKLAPVPNTVDLTKGTWDNATGAPELVTFWQDPDFNAAQNAFYYVRVLEIPTPTWPVYDALKFSLTLPEEVIKIQQERAYSSPIWYTPSA
ncbi:MAG: DUF3604 domain-containing protein [Sphingomonadales bacterium]|nr:DUF3604 domain-containing protein [Sphingomonadales bacterium]NCO50360.1 DUF3604 domain-containing protein [Sphingomonadales bacterium]NCP00620.1 DUF3604 domain-containing protein [Sphingomonadales bacterium]NCP25583.1 DUF3604 domain-containing protein [Sphingomonadales bacterium]NCP44053.1 DUF3604 domain-containing protein [Sphingomonadales bacterium]